ncbi:MAG: GAP family protein [Solirubrobacterales bacterium]|nr:GAP family protein [Solirubrobacterales bacterium]
MNGVIGDLLPAALAVALSPIPIVGVVLILGSPRARTAGVAFAGGWVAGLLAVSAIVIVVAGGGSGSGGDDGLGWLKIALGVLFAGLAAKQWRGRPRPGEQAEQPAWMASIDQASPARAALLGAALSAANPKNLALTLAAAATIADSGLDSGDEVIAVAAFTAIGSVSVVGAVLFRLAAGERADRPLEAIRRFMAEHNAAIMIAVLLVIGAKLIGDGIAAL